MSPIPMKLVSIAVLCLSFGSSVSGLRVVQDVLSSRDIQKLEQTKHCQDEKRSFLSVGQDILSKLNYDSPFGEPVKIQTRSIAQTTRAHQDRHWDSGKVVDDSGDAVAFVFLNTNPDAKFVHAEGQVAVEAGTMVQFRGDLPHHTQVSSGHVQLAGPFHVASMKPVGDTIDPIIDIPNDLLLNLTFAVFIILLGVAVVVVNFTM